MVSWFSSLESEDVGWVSACCSVLLTERMRRIDVELTAALVPADPGTYLLLNVRGVTSTSLARTGMEVKQSQMSEVSRLDSILYTSEQQMTAKDTRSDKQRSASMRGRKLAIM